MARMDTNGYDVTLAGLDDMIEHLPELRDAMLKAEADVIEPSLRQSVVSAGLVDSGQLRRSIKRKRDRVGGVPGIRIGPTGEHHRYLPSKGKDGVVSAGYVGYIGEYGITRKGIKGREWLKKGLETSKSAAFDAAEKEYNAYMDKQK